jgi:hypothetical protein
MQIQRAMKGPHAHARGLKTECGPAVKPQGCRIASDRIHQIKGIGVRLGIERAISLAHNQKGVSVKMPGMEFCSSIECQSTSRNPYITVFDSVSSKGRSLANPLLPRQRRAICYGGP